MTLRVRRVPTSLTGIRKYFGVINDSSQWIKGYVSTVRFWTNNWLGYKIVDKIGIPKSM